MKMSWTMNTIRWGFAISLITAVWGIPSATIASTSATVEIQVNQPGTVISSNLFGIFFEEINFAGDGGIYAEMVRNRSLQQSSTPDGWTVVTDGSANGSISVDYAESLNTNIISSLQLTHTGGTGSVGAGNSGYFGGMSIESGSSYNLSLYAKDNGSFSGSISARLENSNGSTVYDQVTMGSPSSGWQKLTNTLTSSVTDTNARLVVSIEQSGTVWLSMVSLFPETFAGRANGLRLDLANKLNAMEPSFLRFPGGNFIESPDVDHAVRWKKSIGPIEERPGHLNNSWNWNNGGLDYWSTDGLGADEFFRWCEDMNMEPLYDINAGLMLGYNGDPNNTVPLSEMGPWVQDALDLIEYANGDTNTTWGAVRAANGHPEPFNMKYLEIGNENGGTYLDERYTLFYDAIKPVYPDIHLITPGNWAGGRPWSRPVEIMDEHYYANPSTFISYADKYDNYDRNGPKVFVGEYAVTSGYGTYGNLAAALGEAAFMTGIERNSDIVELAAYAPLFAHVDGIQWHPDLIYYDNSSCFGTPAYYVQKMFSRNRGDYVLPTTVDVVSTATNPPPHGSIGLGSWNTAVEYDFVGVTSNGVTLYTNDFSSSATGWNVFNGTWGLSGGTYQQTSDTTTDCRSTTGDTAWADYTLSLRARKLSGSEGFLILFNWQDDNNWTWLNLGGWNNTQHGVEQSINGAKMELSPRTSGSINTGQWYDIDIVINGYHVQCFLDGSLVQDFTYSSSSSAGLHATTSFNEAAGQIVIKAVNPYDTAIDTTFSLSGVGAVSPDATVIQLTSGSPADENSLASPTYVSPVTNTIANADTNFTITLPANSFSILRLDASAIDNYTDLMLDIPSPLISGQQVAGTLWGLQSSGWVNLTTNSGYAITYESQNTGIATVDHNGNVTGVASGTTGIIASYGALGLSVTQSVQVVAAPVILTHRYSFDETGGSTVHDVVGGASWDGTLPNGGGFGGGEVALSAATSDYVELPPYILGSSDAVTIEAWATFPAQLPNACFLFGFGDISGSSGYDYIFCQPQNGRISITDDSYGSEETAYGYTDFSFRTNLHITAVFNPPGGYLALYIDGEQVSINNAVTIPMSSVTNAFSYIGRSLFSGDSYFDFSLDEFRIYSGALSASEIAATQALGPDQLLSTNSPVLNVSASSSNTVINWPVGSAGYAVQSRINLVDGQWVDDPDAAPAVVGDQWEATLPVVESNKFFRLRR